MDQPPLGVTAIPLDWSALGFHPVGLYDLRRRLGKPRDAFHQYRARFEAADVAWYAAGLASKPANVQPHEFYPELHDLRHNTLDRQPAEVRKALRKRTLKVAFDCAALLDRAFGSTTLIVHVPGTTRPNSKKREDFVKAEVYFPGHLAQEDQRYSLAVRDIVQRFIKDVGLPNIARYEYCSSFHWTLPPSNNFPRPYSQQSVQPPATPPGSSTFTYHGRAPTTPVAIVIDDDDELAVTRQSLAEAENALEASRSREATLLAEILLLKKRTTLSAARASTSSQTPPFTPDGSKIAGHQSSIGQAQTQSAQNIGRGSAPRSLSTGKRGENGCPNDCLPDQINYGRRDPSSVYQNFITANNLDSKFHSIERVRLNVVRYLWDIELIKLGVPGEIVDSLVALMVDLSAT